MDAAGPSDARPRLTICLRGGDHRDGEIPLDRLAEIADRTQELMLRVARGLSGREGPGRTPERLTGVVRLMLVGLRDGSTTLDIAGPPVEMELDLGEVVPDSVATQALRVLGDTIHALSSDAPLPDLSAPTYASLGQWLKALVPYPEVEVGSAWADTVGQSTLLRTGEARERLALETEAAPTNSPDLSRRTVEGELYSVNLHTGRYRLEDDLGHSIQLDVPDVLRRRTATLVGAPVRATGIAQLSDGGLIEVLEVTDISDQTGWFAAAEEFRQPQDLTEQLTRSKPIVSLEDMRMSGVSQQEADAFWAALGSRG